MTLKRCEIQGELYTITTNTQVKSPLSLATLSSFLCHDYLGHLSAPVLDSLVRNKLIGCTRTKHVNSSFCHFSSLGKHANSIFCHSYPLNKHVKLSFVDSHKYIYMSFDNLHIDVWTSPGLSSLNHKYYVLFLTTIQITCRLFQFQINLKFIHPFKNKKHISILNFNINLKTFNVTMIENTSMVNFKKKMKQTKFLMSLLSLHTLSIWYYQKKNLFH